MMWALVGTCHRAGTRTVWRLCLQQGLLSFMNMPHLIHVSWTWHGIPFLAQNLEPSSYGLEVSLRVLCSTGPGLPVCQGFPAIQMTLWTFFKWRQMQLGCGRLQLTKCEMLKVLSKTGLLFRYKTAEQNKKTSWATSERHLDTSITL